MSVLVDAENIQDLLRPYLRKDGTIPVGIFSKLAKYLELLEKWNAVTNLTSVREPREIVRRHFGESLFAAEHLGECHTLLDYGSGGGFPGIPMQLLRPELKVTLAESQNKKAAFLREVIRTLGLTTEVWGARVEAMAADTRFDVVALRAVDDMDKALCSAAERAKFRLMILSTSRTAWKLPPGFDIETTIAFVESETQHLLILKRKADGHQNRNYD